MENLNKLKLLWTDIGVQFKGKGIITAWGEEMEKKGWILEKDKEKWRECDLIFFGSDSQVFPECLGEKPTILYFWGWQPAKMLDRGWQKVAAEMLKQIAQCTRILVPSCGTMDQVADFGLPSYLTLPGVDTTLLDAFRYEGKKEIQVMFLSRLAPHKHLEALIQAMSYIRDPRPKLLVSGPGDIAPFSYLADELKVKVDFRELTDEEKVIELKRSSILVHPSSYEGFGLPPLEAMYCGTPAICFDIPQMRWLCQEDAYYFSSVEGLANTIVHIFQNYGEAQAKAASGAKRVSDTLSLPLACDRLWAHIHQVIKEHLGIEVRTKPQEWQRIYDDEHRRNWAYTIGERFDPTWARHWRAQHFIEALKRCKAKKILDVGSGAVYPTIFAKAGFEVHAVDISDECVRQIKSIAEKWGVLDKVHAQQMDANNLRYKAGSFDAVIHGEIWEHLPEPQKAIGEGMRVLKDGGYLIASTPCGEHHDDPMHLSHFNDEMIKNLLEPWASSVVSVEKIAEEGTDPSCYFVIIER